MVFTSSGSVEKKKEPASTTCRVSPTMIIAATALPGTPNESIGIKAPPETALLEDSEATNPS